MKKIALASLCLLLACALAGCATVNSDNSFQNQAPDTGLATQAGQPQSAATAEPAVQPVPAQPTAAQPTALPTQDPNAGGFNG
ncbi:MAG: hypothetical protein GX418_01280 [Clostridiales bacterium]|nr:hypothetical protein [Clostridiales bacterium]